MNQPTIVLVWLWTPVLPCSYCCYFSVSWSLWAAGLSTWYRTSGLTRKPATILAIGGGVVTDDPYAEQRKIRARCVANLAGRCGGHHGCPCFDIKPAKRLGPELYPGRAPKRPTPKRRGEHEQ